jgi:hypothetical protein
MGVGLCPTVSSTVYGTYVIGILLSIQPLQTIQSRPRTFFNVEQLVTGLNYVQKDR